jgi:POT family proton-dependent oligopeptide transporter
MEKILDQSHSQETYLYALSRILERAAYYGLRSLIVLYMIGEVMKMKSSEALSVYGLFTASYVFSHILGSVLGDLVIGNKNAIVIGGIIQALGTFAICIPSPIGLYIGLILVALGGGLYTSNLTSNFGKLYLNKTKLLDAGFTLLYLAANIGALVGVVLIGYLGETYSWSIGFITSGIIMILSTIPILFSQEKRNDNTAENTFSINQRIIKISIALIFVSLFWAIYEIASFRIYDLESKLSEVSSLNIPRSLWSSLNAVFVLPISIAAIIIWTYLYSTQFFKLAIGFVFGTMSFGILYLIPEVPSEQHTLLYIGAVLFLAISEICIAPIIHSVLTKYTNPKYLAIMISLAFIPTRLFSFLIGLFNEGLYENPSTAIIVGLIAMSVLSILIIIYNLTSKNNTKHNN